MQLKTRFVLPLDDSKKNVKKTVGFYATNAMEIENSDF